MDKIIGRLPTIPEYYREYINKQVDLESEPKQCCPFHNEDTPSFSYSADKGVWRCFGSCHCGGDVIALHKKNYGFKSVDEAKRSLYELYSVKDEIDFNQAENMISAVNTDTVEKMLLYNKALLIANDVDKWLELDYIMSKYPLELADLRTFIEKHNKKGVFA